MNIWIWIAQNFKNGELFFYLIPVLLFILMIVVIFLPDEDEIDESKDDVSDEKSKPKEEKTLILEEKEKKVPVFEKKQKETTQKIKSQQVVEQKQAKKEPEKKQKPKIETKTEPKVVETTKNEVEIKDEEKTVEPEKKKDEQEVEKTEPQKEKKQEIKTEKKTIEPKQEKPVKEKTIKEGLHKTKKGFMAKLKNLLSSSVVDDDLIEELEEILYTADIGVKTVTYLLEEVEKNRKKFKSGDDVKEFLKSLIKDILKSVEKEFKIEKKSPFVILMVGVNGAGKTTTIGKLSHKIKQDFGMSVLLGAGDTFRAAAVEQLAEWGKRTNCEVVRDKEGADPGAVAYNSVESAKSKNIDVAIIDTAGRLQNRVNLMNELKKVKKVTGKAHEGAPHEVLLVIDANNGQNALTQAKDFNEAVSLTGIVVSKLDGSAKAGIVIGIAKELGIPIYFIGIGEQVADLRPFNANDFVEALFE